jgi:FixJ family two-component response regulator
MRPFVAVVDNEPAIRSLIRIVAEKAGFEVGEYASGRTFLGRYQPQPGCVVIELSLPQCSGFEVIEEMRRRRCWKVPVVVMSGGFPSELMPALETLGDLILLEKPFAVATLLEALERAIVIDSWERRERSFRP